MIHFESISIDYNDPNSLTVFWDFLDTAEDISAYTLEIYRSESPNDFTLITTIADPTVLNYIDDSLQGINNYKYITWFYQLKLTSPTTEVFTSEPYHLKYPLHPKAKKILKAKEAGLRQYGTNFKVGKKVKAAVNCPDCWDNILMRSTDSQCSTCNGTGRLNGYSTYIDVIGAFSTSTLANNISDIGKSQDYSATLSILNYPRVFPEDVIVSEKGEQFRVVRVDDFKFKLALISQRLLLIPINKEKYLHVT